MSEHPKSILISGESGMGKSLSLRNLRGQEGVLYLNCEGGKPLPFKNKFKRITITDPMEVFTYYDAVRDDEKGRYHTIVTDTISFMMDRYESVHVKTATNTMEAWGQYGEFFRELMLTKVAESPAMSVMLGHLQADLVESTGEYKYSVPVKGALAKKGLEAYFTTVMNVTKVKVKDLTPNALLHTSERDKDLGFQHVFQTRTTKKTLGDRIRSPMGLFSDDEVYVDNDVQVVLDRLAKYYKD